VAFYSPTEPETPDQLARMLVLAKRWLPPPQTLHPFPDARFAAGLRDKNRMR
jgi:hypothetical protein